jgi:hypothetical protein
MLENGVPMATVAQARVGTLNHVPDGDRYGNIRPDAQRQALGSIAAGLPCGKALVFEGGVHQNGNQGAVAPS